jgi:hypothetical protein
MGQISDIPAGQLAEQTVVDLPVVPGSVTKKDIVTFPLLTFVDGKRIWRLFTTSWVGGGRANDPPAKAKSKLNFCILMVFSFIGNENR